MPLPATGYPPVRALVDRPVLRGELVQEPLVFHGPDVVLPDVVRHELADNAGVAAWAAPWIIEL